MIIQVSIAMVETQKLGELNSNAKYWTSRVRKVVKEPAVQVPCENDHTTQHTH
jgi:hypothetical protein